MATNQVLPEFKQVSLPVSTGTSSGDPLVVWGIPVVADEDEGNVTTGYATCITVGSWDLSVAAVDDSGDTVIAAGDIIYYDATQSPVLSRRTSGVSYGKAAATVTVGATATIEVIIGQWADSDGVSGRGTSVVFTENPVVAGVGGGASVGTDNAVNVFTVNGETFEYQNNGTQTLLGPSLSSAGLVVSLDLTNNEGAIFDQGITALSKSAFVVGTDAPALSISFVVADVSGLDICWLGWRKLAARNDDPTAYTDFALIGPISGDIKTMTDLNGSGAEVITDTTNNWADGEAHELEVIVSSAGAVSYKIDGVAPLVSPTATFTFDDGDTIIPVFQFIHDVTTPGAITWKKWEVSL